MRNVWAVPAPRTVVRWLESAGFGAVRSVDISATTGDEQRRTAWMPHHSLAEFLDPRNSSLTIEGHPAPLRAVFVASAQ
jgi:tRNA (mo5U34)-methyltransferase